MLLAILLTLMACLLADAGLTLVGILVTRTQATPTPIVLATATPRPTPNLRLAPATPGPTIDRRVPIATPTQRAFISPTGFPLLPFGTPVPPGNIVQEQAAAMIPSARGELARLSNLPVYRIDVMIDPDTLTLYGRQRVHFVNTSPDSLKDIVFRLYANSRAIYGGGKLLPTQVEVESTLIQPAYDLDRTVMRLALPRPLLPGTAVDLTINFAAQIPRDFGGADKPGYGIFNFTDGVLALGDWYPVLAVYKPRQGWDAEQIYPEGDAVFSPTAFYSVSLRAPESWTIAATGLEVGQAKHADGTITRRYVTGPVRDFFIALSRDFKVASAQVENTKVNSYFLSADEQGGRKVLEIATGALQAYNQRFGTYPFTELDVVDTPLDRAAGVEWPGLVLIGKDLYGNPDSRILALATSHEVAHQWWYAVVGNDQLDEPWLDEALATFSSGLWAEFAQGSHAYQDYVDAWQRTYDQTVLHGKDDIVGEPVAHFSGDGERYSIIVYQKGALFYANLRREIGDEAFFKGLQRYYLDHKYGVATSEDIVKAFESVTNKDVRGIYQQWVKSAQK